MGRYDGSNERYNAAFKPKPTFGLDGILYRSGLEARVAGAMSLLKMGAEYEPASFPLPNIVGGFYTPDFILPDPFSEDGRQVVEVGGFDSEKKRVAAKSFKSKSDDPNDVHHITSYVQVWTSYIDLHRDGKDYCAEVRKCDDCDGPGWFAPIVGEHVCPHCGSKHTSFVTKDMNDWFNAQYKMMWEPNWQRAEAEAKADKAASKNAGSVNRRNADVLRELARRFPEWELKKGDGFIRFMSKTEEKGSYTPEFAYTEPFKNRETKGTAFDPIAIVSVEDKPTTWRKNTFEQLIDYVKDGHNPLVKHAVYNSRGWFVADFFTGGEYRKGHLYKCPECGKVYPAADADSTCPCCGNKTTHLIDLGDNDD